MSNTLVIRLVDDTSLSVERLCMQILHRAGLSPAFPHRAGCMGRPTGNRKDLRTGVRHKIDLHTHSRRNEQRLHRATLYPTRTRSGRNQRPRKKSPFCKFLPARPQAEARKRSARRQAATTSAPAAEASTSHSWHLTQRETRSFPHLWMKTVHTGGKL